MPQLITVNLVMIIAKMTETKAKYKLYELSVSTYGAASPSMLCMHYVSPLR